MAKEDPERQARLSEALRANLRRRKAQARAVTDERAQGDPPEPDRHSRDGGNP